MRNFDENNYDPQATRLVEKLRHVPERDEVAAARGRQRFLSEARSLAGQSRRPAPAHPQAVPLTSTRSKKGWLATLFGSGQSGQRRPAFTLITSLLIIVAILFGGTSATVYAAQDSQPESLLYPLKTFSEDVRLNLSADPDTKLDLVLDFANRRIEEMAAIKMQGRAIPDEVFQRYQDHLRQAYQLAADMDDDALDQAVRKIHINLRDQDRLMSRTNIPEDAETVMVRETVRNQIRVLEDQEAEIPVEEQFSMRQRMEWMSDEQNDLTEGPYRFQRGDSDPTQDPDPGGDPGNQPGPGPAPGKNPAEGEPDDDQPGNGNDHDSAPKTPHKNGQSG